MRAELAEAGPDGAALRRAFWARERQRCADPEAGFAYWMTNYASHAPASGEGRDRLVPWPKQRDLIEILPVTQSIIAPKSRRAGVTVLCLHYLTWLCAFCSATPGAKCAILSRNFKAAKEALAEVKAILGAQPAGLLGRHEYGLGAAKKWTEEEIGFARGATLYSYPANGARGGTYRCIVLDEHAWVEGPVDAGEKALAAVLPTTEGGGQAIIVSSGNGRTGRGAAFARMVEQVDSGALKRWRMFFFGRWDRPGRDQAWWEDVVRELGSFKAAQEYPLTIDDALGGDAEGAHLPMEHINLAIRLGAQLREQWEAGDLPLPRGGRILAGKDWGYGVTAGIVGYPLGAGDMWACAEMAVRHASVQATTTALAGLVAPWLAPGVVFDDLYYDAAGAQQAATMLPFLDELSPETACHGVAFGRWRKFVISYLRGALERTANDWDPEAQDFRHSEPARLAIDPSLVELIGQLRGGKMGEGGDRVKGSAADPDHSFDALVCLLWEQAVAFDS